MTEMKTKVAVVTGGNGVLGGAIAMGFAKKGMHVGILGRNEQTVNKRVEEIRQMGGSASPMVADVLDEQALERVREELEAEYGPVSVLVNAAGGNVKGATITPEQTIFDLDMADFDKVTQLNFKGSVLPTLVFGKSMVKHDRGSIINISSMTAQKPITRVMGYSAAKASVDHFTKWLATEINSKFGENIRVNAIAPGFFVGEQNRDLLLNGDGSLTSRGQAILEHTPMKRFGKPEELQGVANWLAGDESSFVTGIVVPVDGGFSAFGGL
ncbi:MAG: SDR family oxidoreductase [Christiangramia sp.]|nr:D-mannonate oxidoreductase [Christiangramia sp.]